MSTGSLLSRRIWRQSADSTHVPDKVNDPQAFALRDATTALAHLEAAGTINTVDRKRVLRGDHLSSFRVLDHLNRKFRLVSRRA